MTAAPSDRPPAAYVERCFGRTQPAITQPRGGAGLTDAAAIGGMSAHTLRAPGAPGQAGPAIDWRPQPRRACHPRAWIGARVGNAAALRLRRAATVLLNHTASQCPRACQACVVARVRPGAIAAARAEGRNAGAGPRIQAGFAVRLAAWRRLPPGLPPASRTGSHRAPGSADHISSRPRGRSPTCCSGSAGGAGRSSCWPSARRR